MKIKTIPELTIIVYALVLFCTNAFFATAAECRPATEFQITGSIPQAQSKKITLRGFHAGATVLLSDSVTDKNGHFIIRYPASYVGASLLEIDGLASVIILLNRENFKMEWRDLDDLATLHFNNSFENDAFAQGTTLYSICENKRSGLRYLIPLYADDPAKQKFLIDEFDKQSATVNAFLDGLPTTSYVKYYLTLRRLHSDMIQLGNSDRLGQNEMDFTAIDFGSENFIRSGMFTELVNAFISLAETYGGKVYDHLNYGTMRILQSLHAKPALKQDVAEYLFNQFEKRSMFKASEYLSNQMISDESCTLDEKRTALFEQYRKMAIGMAAPNIKIINNGQPKQELHDITDKNKLVIFGAGSCPKCVEEMKSISARYDEWKPEMEVIFVSLDTARETFESIINGFGGIVSCDLKGWQSQAAKDFYVFATPTMYLIDRNNKIVLKPVSAAQIDAWIDFSATHQ